MKNFFKSKIYIVILIIGLFYAAYVLYAQQEKINSYDKEKKYLQDQISELNEHKEELIVEKESVDSPEYIEDIARQKLDMYLPNEKVFIDMNK